MIKNIDYCCKLEFFKIFVVCLIFWGNKKIPFVTPATAGVGLYSVSNANHKNYKIVTNVNLKDPIPAYAGMTKIFQFLWDPKSRGMTTFFYKKSCLGFKECTTWGLWCLIF